jgi:predicted metalloprotease with PDZ domain
MKRSLFKILILLFSCSIHSQIKLPDNRLDYHLSWDGKSTLLEIDLMYNSNGKDSTVFIFGQPTPGSQPKMFERLRDLQTDKPDFIETQPDERKIIMHHKTSGVKHLHFTINCELIVNVKAALGNEAFLPTIAPGFLYTLGYQLFLQTSDKSYTEVGVVWDSWPKDMPFVVSTNPEAAPDQMQVLPLDQNYTNTFMLQMGHHLSINKYAVNGIPNYLITSRSDTGTLPEQLIPFVKNFIPQVRDFWKDYDAPYYILSAIPLRNKVGSTMTGMGLKNGFSIRYNGPLDIEKTQLIAHEISHNWIGIRLRYESKGAENNWFNEGLNDYIAVYNLARTGLFDDEAFLNHMNKHNLAPHYKSPVGNLPGDSIAAHFNDNHLYEKIPYQRGLIYAFYLDNQIRLASAGEKTIRDFLLDLYTRNKADHSRPITIDDFTKAIKPLLSEDIVAWEIQNYMLNGDLIDFNKVKLIDAFTVKYTDGVPILGLSAKTDLKKIYR